MPAKSTTSTPVLFLHRGGNQVRGSEEALLTLLDGLDRREFHPVVVCSNPVLAAVVTARGIDCRVEDFPEIMLVPGELRLPVVRYFRALFRLMRLSRRMDARIVFSNGGGPCQLAVPLAVLLRLRSVCLLHHPASRSLHFFWLTRFVDVMVFASEFTAKHTKERTGQSGHVAHIGIDAKRFAPAIQRDPTFRRNHGIQPDAIVFAQIGALVRSKGHDLLLDTFHRIRGALPSARLFIIGTGPEAERIQNLVCSLGLADRVTLTGYVEDTVPYLRHVVDVNILASFEEGLGLVNLQASACALPNVATDGTGIRETIIHERTGFLFRPGDAAELGSYMIRLAGDPLLRASFGAEGRKFVVERFSPEKYSTRMQEILRATTTNRTASGE